MKAVGHDYYSESEVRAILAKMSSADQIRLRKISYYQASKLKNGDPDELLTEGFTRILEGRRKWPRGLELAVFMKNVLGSIMTAEAKHDAYKNEYEVDIEVNLSGEIDCPQNGTEQNSSPDIADVIYTREMLDRLVADLEKDQSALAVAMALAEGHTAKEVQKRFQLSAREYGAARKRLRRTAAALLDEEVMA